MFQHKHSVKECSTYEQLMAGVVASYLNPDLSMAAQDGHVWSLSCGSWSPVSPASLWEHGQHISTPLLILFHT